MRKFTLEKEVETRANDLIGLIKEFNNDTSYLLKIIKMDLKIMFHKGLNSSFREVFGQNEEKPANE